LAGSIADSEMPVNQLKLLSVGIERYNACGGFENDQSSIKELYMDDQLQPSISALEQLSPSSQELVVSLIRQLAERENINVPLSPFPGLQTPADGIALWEANCISEGLSRGTISGYKILIQAYLKDDPFPTTLSIKQFLASKMGKISPIGVGNYIRALRSLFSFLKAEGLWNTDPTAGIRKPKVGKKEREIPTEDEVTKLLTTLFSDQDRKRDKPKAMAWIVTLITTGLRRTELASLTWDKVDFKHPEARVIGKGKKERVRRGTVFPSPVNKG